MVMKVPPRRINPGSFAHNVGMDCLACAPDLEQLIQSEAALQGAWAALPRRHLAGGELLLRSGDEVRAVWRVEAGLVRLYYLAADGMQRNRSFHAEGQWLGAGVPLSVSQSPYMIEALEPTVLVELRYPSLQAWMDVDAVRVRLADALAATVRQRDAREESLLLKDATTRYLDFMASEPRLAARVPLHHVASYLGITNVALSRIRRKLKG
jgi:CRP-like cAMP-binding protein